MSMMKRASRVAADEDGMSLVELLVAMFITAIALSIIGAMFVNVARITSNANATATRNGMAANIMDEVSKTIRTAANNAIATSVTPDPALVSASPTALTLYSYVNANPAAPAPTKVGFRFDTQLNLVEDTWTATLSQNYWVFTGSPSTRVVGGPVQNLTGTSAFFVYRDSTGAEIPYTSGTSLLLAERRTVASITVNVRIANQPTTGADPIVITNTVGMPNLNLSRTN
jgi:prepilin-type N-terminal cleavage/methylation domain-containing protein